MSSNKSTDPATQIGPLTDPKLGPDTLSELWDLCKQYGYNVRMKKLHPLTEWKKLQQMIPNVYKLANTKWPVKYAFKLLTVNHYKAGGLREMPVETPLGIPETSAPKEMSLVTSRSIPKIAQLGPKSPNRLIYHNDMLLSSEEKDRFIIEPFAICHSKNYLIKLTDIMWIAMNVGQFEATIKLNPVAYPKNIVDFYYHSHMNKLQCYV